MAALWLYIKDNECYNAGRLFTQRERILIDITIRHDHGRTKNDEVLLCHVVGDPIRQLIACAFHLPSESIGLSFEPREGNWTMPKLTIELSVDNDDVWRRLNRPVMARLKGRLIQAVGKGLPLQDHEMELAIFKA